MAAGSLTSSTRPDARRPAVQLRYASFEARVTAGIIDALCMLIIASLFITAGALVVLFSSEFEQVDPSTASINFFWACAGAIVPAFLLYFFIGYAWRGQTVGAAVMQLMIVRSDGRPLGILGAASRVIGQLIYVLFALAGILGAYALKDSSTQAAIATGVAFFLISMGFLMAIFDGKRRMLHDRIAGTIVVRIL